MKKALSILAVILQLNFLHAQSIADLSFGEESTLEIVTWNIEYFPKNGQSTIDSVKKVILALDADVLALQEIDEESSFTQLINDLPGWGGYHVPGSWPSLAYLYKTAVIDVDSIFEIYTSESTKFPRSPLVMEMKFQGESFTIINNHLKCCGDGILNYNDPNDEERRRYDANILLDQWIVSNHPNDRVIMLGDLNDELTNSTNDNVFQNFIADFTKYKFVDMGIAQGPSSNWSYPSWPSHLDHIMITNELFIEFANDSSDVQTIKVDNYLSGGWSQYDALITDHRPVGIKLQINPTIISVDEANVYGPLLTIFPNPSSGAINFVIQSELNGEYIEIYDMHGLLISALNISENQQQVVWNNPSLSTGVYLVKLLISDQVSSIQKLVLIKN